MKHSIGISVIVSVFNEEKTIKNIFLYGLEHPKKFHKTSFLSASKEFLNPVEKF
ncbi:MAG: hypothetical protein JEY97_10495 [Bacteroidales bacterium]|nr:hypothetical protein [Bacteroidales bacterium]